MTIHLGTLATLPPGARTVIFIGTRSSDHLRELIRIAEFKGRAAYRIESAAELQPRWFSGAEDVGIVPGAADLQTVVRAAIERLHQFAAAEACGMMEGGAMNGEVASLPSASGPDQSGAAATPRLGPLLAALASAIAAFDVCFWDVDVVGISEVVFFLILAGILCVYRKAGLRRRSLRGFFALLGGAAWAGLIEPSSTNTTVLLVLTIALAGELAFGSVSSFWGCWLFEMGALVRAPGRIIWLGRLLLRETMTQRLNPGGSILGGILLLLPAVLLALIFGGLLASGNMVFGNWTGSFFARFWNLLLTCLDPFRLSLWAFVALMVLPLLQPAALSKSWWNWMQKLPRLPELVPCGDAKLSSSLVLIIVNLLFFVANLADALFLWSGLPLPEGTTYSGYVHHGVNTLTFAALLSALVLTILFQQTAAVAQARELKFLAVVWIGQNLFLLLSVALRLKLYIDAYAMTTARLSVLIFLLLVATGYVLLTIMILAHKSLSWLLAGGGLALFATLYVTQFLDLAGWSADYNVARWAADRKRDLDVTYLSQDSPGVWPAVRRAHEIDPANPRINEILQLQANTPGYTVQTGRDWRHGREFTLRACWNQWALEESKNRN